MHPDLRRTPSCAAAGGCPARRGVREPQGPLPGVPSRLLARKAGALEQAAGVTCSSELLVPHGKAGFEERPDSSPQDTAAPGGVGAFLPSRRPLTSVVCVTPTGSSGFPVCVFVD